MKINTVNHSLEHNVWLVASLFFKDNEDIDITSSAEYGDGFIASETSIKYNNEIYSGSYRFDCRVSDEHEKKRITSAVCGMALYNAAQKIQKKRLPWGVMTGIRPAKPMRQMLADGKSPEYVLDYISRLYKPEQAKLELALDVAQNELELLKKNHANEMGLYIGIPFCPTRCLYCSFVSTDLRHSKKYVDDFLACLLREIEYAARLVREYGKTITSIYVGGGTPTSLDAPHLDALLSAVENHFDLSAIGEYCVEAGRPDTIDLDKLTVLKNHGVDRISINPQTMHDKTLALIGRAHTSADITRAFELARRVGFDTLNTDLIAGLPGESKDDFAYTLNAINEYKPENITVHTMSIKRGSALHQKLESYKLTESDVVYDMLDASYKFMKQTGRAPYYMYRQKNMLGNLENVGYSIKGHESLYNVNIMEETQSILALGGGGSSKAVSADGERIERVFNFKSPIEYISRFDEILAKKDEFFKLL